MKSYLYSAGLVAVVATPTMAAEQLTDNQMDQITAGWMLSAPQAAAHMMPGMTTSGAAKTQAQLAPAASPPEIAAKPAPVAPTTAATQPAFEVIVNSQGVFITHQGAIDLATLAILPNSAFTVTSSANTIVLSVPH